jgi:zinc transporter 2
LVLFTTYGIAKECLRVLMEGTPSGIFFHFNFLKGFVYADFEKQLKEIKGIIAVHDLHVWALSVGKPAMSAHIVCIDKSEIVLERATRLCR